MTYKRDPELDPQLVWRGKDTTDAEDLIVDAPPIFIQEKIDPERLIREFRRAHGATIAQDPTLFDDNDFDGLDDLSLAEPYRHDAKWSNRLILGDSLLTMTSLAEHEHLRGKVQMVYIDPPYGIKFNSNWQPTVGKRDVKDGKAESVAREVEAIKAFRDTWSGGIHTYLSYLRDRLIAARDLLTSSGSCFVQIGDDNVHVVRSLLDEVFGPNQFVSQISYSTTSGFTQSSAIGRSGDYILWYAADIGLLKSRTLWRKAIDRQGYNWVQLEDNSTRSRTKSERDGQSPLPKGSRLYAPDNLVSQGASRSPQEFQFRGNTYSPPPGSHWKATFPSGMEKLAHANRIHIARNSIRYIRYPEDFGWIAWNNNWTDTATGNFTDDKLYVVQTGSKAIERCMLMCTDPGDLVLDPTCGSGTTAYVAEHWGRRWITIDTSRVALALARQRIMTGRFPHYLLADSAEGKAKEAALAGSAIGLNEKPTNDIRQGFVYERIQRITLGSIANNPDLKEGMSREEIDAAIKRHADFEYLYDKPYEDKKKVRVAGPFTVESLSPHRSASFDDVNESAERESISEAAAETDVDNPDFVQTILDNLLQAGIQNGRRHERIDFSSVDSYAGQHIQAVGTRSDNEDDLVALCIGPQYGTVDGTFIKDAVREAMQDSSIGLLCVLAFAFDPNATGVTEDDGITIDASDDGFASVAGERKLGRIKVLLVRMNSDLLMGEALKKTGAGNLFTVFGEPDIELQHTDDDRLVVDLRGVDVYDPNTGDVRSDNTDKIALWMIDTDYNGEAFFVRHCYFTGGNDSYKKLKTTLKADIDADAWSALYKTTSRPFSKPGTGKIAVKVINDYGDEVTKVIDVT
ncbi:site-specific DNA-methyltransferase [Jongsikchunia kroppenstedtii]|uniref:site-specific DNA-methyltransferase n=1 Tax=Jongsikchunia kroppenstedtii TaxID=1121721 RepID=UPI001FE22B1F|nr:site-specific DNA-methyltransferase [Jongsikchunia kroppenstedtii]